MTADNTPQNNGVGAIEFYDGRVVRVTNFEVNPTNLPENSPLFSTEPNLNCPVPTCSMYADIVFVLDSSGSVSSSEWKQQANFVISVMNSFSFGDSGAAAAVVQFNAPACGKQPSWKYFSSCKNKDDEGNRAQYDWDYSTKCSSNSQCNTAWNWRSPGCCCDNENTTARTASILAGSGSGNSQTVSTSRDDLITIMRASRTPEGGTCQAMGLDLAMKVFDRSPRNNYANKPHRIVIAVTDGADYCPNKTRAAADKLRNEYDALFLGVGVGLSCNYDKDFIKSLTSTVAGQRAYYDVTNYDAIKNVAEQIFTPLCDELHSPCRPDCNGFCGCGDCFCPTCDSTGSKCDDYRCTAGGGASNGCQMTEIDTCPEDDICTQYQCADATGECTPIKTCAEMEANNPGTCRSVKCDLKDGSCKVELDHGFCSRQFDSECMKYECAAEGETSGINYDAETGCRLKTDGNKTAECKKMNNGCWDYTCDITSGECVREDTCGSLNTKCKTFACSQAGECVGTEIPAPAANTSCIEYACHDESGWGVVLEKTPQYCKDESANKSCKVFRCDVNLPEGCTYDVVEDCNELCDSMTQQCLDEGHSDSTIEQCKLLVCRVHDVGEGPEPYCTESKSVNCLDESESPAAVEAREMNEANPDVCFTVECDHGGCKTVMIPKPTEDDKRDTRCRKNVCVFTEGVGWNWVQRDSEEKTTCVANDCFYKECDDDEGCVSVDICRNRTTACTTFSCVNNECVHEAVELKETECTFEVCENEKIVTKPKDIKIACPNEDKCKEAVCSELGECVYVNVTHEPNPCKIFECDPKVGWIGRDKCDDGIYCTNDTCTVNGECRHSSIDCYNELNMSEYPCFRAVCKEDAKNKKYVCSRKKRDGVYIDLCGKCVREDGAEESSDVSLVGGDDCTIPEEDVIPKNELAAATIAMIVLGAIIIGAAVASSTVLGTKALLDRAKAANNQSAHSNPLFEGDQTEMSNPAFAGEEA